MSKWEAFAREGIAASEGQTGIVEAQLAAQGAVAIVVNAPAKFAMR